MLNIIVVEDHDALREITVEALLADGHHVIGLDCAEALPELSDVFIDLMVIDLNLPGEDGISLAKRMRDSQPNIGIIMLTARIQTADKLTGYQNGADIYLTKPTSLEELRAAIHALMRRIKPVQANARALKLDMRQLMLTGELSSESLTKHESILLSAFARANEQKLESWQLIQLLGEHCSKANLEVQIARLRKKMLAVGASQTPIKAIREYGYQLCEAIQLL